MVLFYYRGKLCFQEICTQLFFLNIPRWCCHGSDSWLVIRIPLTREIRSADQVAELGRLPFCDPKRVCYHFLLKVANFFSKVLSWSRRVTSRVSHTLFASSTPLPIFKCLGETLVWSLLIIVVASFPPFCQIVDQWLVCLSRINRAGT